MKRVLFLCLLLLCPVLLQAQQPAYFLLGEKELEGVDIYNVIQDNAFNYWLATNQGIMLHDGYSFRTIECEAMKSSSVFNFVKDSRGVIYCHNLNHQIFKIEKGKCTLFFEIPESGRGADIYLLPTLKNELVIVSNEMYVVDANAKIVSSSSELSHTYIGPPYLLKDGSVICSQSTFPLGLRYQHGKMRIIRYGIPSDFQVDLTHHILEFFRIDKQSYAVEKASKQLFQLDEKQLRLTTVYVENPPSSAEHVRYYPLADRLWVASSVSGIQAWKPQASPAKCSEKYYPDYFISHVAKDAEGNTLLSTFGKGILVLPHLNMPDVKPELTPFPVSSVISDENGATYLGTNRGEIVQKLGVAQKILTREGTKSVDNLYKWPGKPYLLSDISGFTIRDLEKKTTTNFGNIAFKCATQLNADQLLIGSNIGVHLLSYDPVLHKISILAVDNLQGRVHSMQKDGVSAQVYIASTEGLKIRESNGSVRFLKVDDTIVFASAFAVSGKETFIVTRKKGILVVSKGKTVRILNPVYKKEPIKISKIQIHGKDLFVNSSVGLLVLTRNGKINYFLNKASGLSTQKIIDFDVKDNQIWISHARGVQVIQLSSLKAGIVVPRLFLSKMEVNRKQIQNRHQFSADENKFIFHLSVPTLKSRENTSYHYQLLPIDNTWNVNNYEENKVVYNALSPGSYNFVVKAENNGVFSKPLYYSFTIVPPIYQRGWFIGLLVVLVLSLVSLYYRRLLRRQKIKADQLNELNASKLTAIQSQMNPHFIFNALNSIQDLVLKGDVNNSYTFITKFSNLVRRTLNYSAKDFIEFEQEIKLLELYLSLEKLRFKENLEITMETNDIDDIRIPPMLIQPFIENALLHGLLHKEGLKKLSITFRLDETLICEITDNGIGRQKAKEIKERQRSEHESFAMGAIKRRFEILQKQCKESIGFEYEDLFEEGHVAGTKVILKIPIQHSF